MHRTTILALMAATAVALSGAPGPAAAQSDLGGTLGRVIEGLQGGGQQAPEPDYRDRGSRRGEGERYREGGGRDRDGGREADYRALEERSRQLDEAQRRLDAERRQVDADRRRLDARAR